MIQNLFLEIFMHLQEDNGLNEHLQYKPSVHDDVIKWKHFPRNWPFVWGIHRSPVNSPHKGQWRGALMFSLICTWIHDWVNNREASDLRRYRAHYDVSVMGMKLAALQLHHSEFQHTEHGVKWIQSWHISNHTFRKHASY